MTAPAAHRPVLPEPWVWDRDPWQVAAAIAAGHDPADLPHAEVPVLVYREPGVGWPPPSPADPRHDRYSSTTVAFW